MARRKVRLADNIARVIFVDDEATVGATIGTNLYMANGQVATPALLAAYIGAVSSVTVQAGSSGNANHSTLQNLSANDHPQYALVASLATVAFSGDYGDLSGVPRTLIAGTNIAFDDTVPGQRTISASGGGGSSVIIAVQETDLVVTSNNTFQDTSLLVALAVGTYLIELDWAVLPNATPDMEIEQAFTGTLSSIRMNRRVFTGAALATSRETALFTASYTTTGLSAQQWAGVVEVTAPGDFKLRVRQITSSPTAVTFYAGSFIRATPIA
jgi:hypothetical protein